MNLNEYQEAACATAIYPESAEITYPALGLAGEAGEVANKVKKWVRGDGALDRMGIAQELGDVLWYVATLANDLDISLELLAQDNLHKLAARKARGTLQGNGDNR